MDNSLFKFARDAKICDNDVRDNRTVIGRVFDYDAEDFFYLVEDRDGDIEKWSVKFGEAHFELVKD